MRVAMSWLKSGDIFLEQWHAPHAFANQWSLDDWAVQMKSDMTLALQLERLVRDAYSDKRSSAIQPLQWKILRYLEHARNFDSDIKSISSSIGVTVAPVSRAVSTLELRGLVSKGEHPLSKKSISVNISKMGLATLSGEDPILKIRDRIQALSAVDRERLAEMLEELLPDSGKDR